MTVKNEIMYDSVYITLLKICYCTWNDVKKMPILFREHNFKLSLITSTFAFLKKVN